MDSSAAAMISLTVPARNGTAEEREPAGQRGALVVLAMPSARWAQQAGCSADGLRGRLDLCGQISPQPVIVMLQIFDHALKIAHPRPQSAVLHVAGEAGQAQLQGPRASPPAEPDTLDPPSDKDRGAFHEAEPTSPGTPAPSLPRHRLRTCHTFQPTVRSDGDSWAPAALPRRWLPTSITATTRCMPWRHVMATARPPSPHASGRATATAATGP